MRGAQGVEAFGQFRAVRGGQVGQLQAGRGLRLAGATLADEQLGHLVGADLVKLVDLAQHAFDVVQSQTTVEALGQFAVVRVHGGLRQAELAQGLQRGDHHQRQFHFIVVGQFPIADHVDVGLHEFAETALLGRSPRQTFWICHRLKGKARSLACSTTYRLSGTVRSKCRPNRSSTGVSFS